MNFKPGDRVVVYTPIAHMRGTIKRIFAIDAINRLHGTPLGTDNTYEVTVDRWGLDALGCYVGDSEVTSEDSYDAAYSPS